MTILEQLDRRQAAHAVGRRELAVRVGVDLRQDESAAYERPPGRRAIVGMAVPGYPDPDRDQQRFQQGFELGCNDYVTKPINSIELMTKVKNHLS